MWNLLSPDFPPSKRRLQFDKITIGIAEKNLAACRAAAMAKGDPVRRKLVGNVVEIPDPESDMTIVGKRGVHRKILLHHDVQFLIANGKPRSAELEPGTLDFLEPEDCLVKLARPFKVAHKNRGMQILIDIDHGGSFLTLDRDLYRSILKPTFRVTW